MIKIKVNGESEELEEGSSILTVLQEKEMKPEMVAVEVNGELLSKEEYGEKILIDGDAVEFLYYMAGGE